MKKYIFTLILCLYFSSAHAATVVQKKTNTENIVPNVTKKEFVEDVMKEIVYTPEFIEHLKNCESFEVTKKIESPQLHADYIAQIMQGNNQYCRLQTSISNQFGNLGGYCMLEGEDLSEFVDLISQISAYNFSLPSQYNFIRTNASLISSLARFFDNEAICRLRFNFDESKELREKLTDCLPFSSRIHYFDENIDVIIHGSRAKDECLVEIIHDRKRTKTSHGYCTLSDYNLEELKLALEQLRIDSKEFSVFAFERSSSLDDLLDDFESDGICKASQK